jgi:hypothetical protein
MTQTADVVPGNDAPDGPRRPLVPPPADPVEIPQPVEAYIARTIPAFDEAMFNTIKLVDPQPIVQPRVRIWRQGDSPWGSRYLRPKGKRNNENAVTDKDIWVQNGCHPTCLAMVLHWWSELNPATKGKLVFPYAGADGAPCVSSHSASFRRMSDEPAGITPLELCRRLFNTDTAPTSGGGGNEYSVNHGALMKGMQQVLFDRGDKRIAMTAKGYSTGGTKPEIVKQAMKFFLTLGPIVLCLNHPGHFVLVDGYRDDKMYICDPGSVIDREGFWTGLSSIHEKEERRVVVSDAATNLEYQTDKKMTPEEFKTTYHGSRHYKLVGGKVRLMDQRWLPNITTFQVFYFDPLDEHNEWSDPSLMP